MAKSKDRGNRTKNTRRHESDRETHKKIDTKNRRDAESETERKNRRSTERDAERKNRRSTERDTERKNRRSNERDAEWENRRNTQKEMERQILRHRKRVRNQVISYLFFLILFAAIVAGAFYGGKILLVQLQDYSARRQEAFEEAQEHAAAEETGENEGNTAEETEEAPETEETEGVDYLMELVDSHVAGMSLEDKIQGLFLITPETLTGVGKAIQAEDGTKLALETNPVGGLFYTELNFQSEEQFNKMIENTVSFSKYPLFLSMTGMDNPASHGMNLSFLPTETLVVEGGGDASAVSSTVASSVSELAGQNMSVCLAGFPGEGSALEGSSIESTLVEMQSAGFLPYQAGIEAGAEMVQVSDMAAPKVAGEGTSCTLSNEVVTGQLRTALGFEGIIISGDLSSDTIVSTEGEGNAAVEALTAGCDMLYNPADYAAAYKSVLDAVNAGTISEEQINDSLRRIYRVKYKDSLE